MTTTDSTTTLIDVFCQAAMRATADVITRKRISPDVAGPVTESLKALALPAYDELIRDLAEAQGMGEPIMRQITNAAAYTLAIKALQQAGCLPVQEA